MQVSSRVSVRVQACVHVSILSRRCPTCFHLCINSSGVLFHYRAPHDRYALSFPDAQRVCLENSAVIATPAQLQATFADGYDNCDAGWLSDQSVRYPIQSPRPGCYGDRQDSPGVRNYGNRAPDELFDVYCFSKQLQGEVFHLSVPEKLSLATASTHCHALNAQLATAGQLYLAWQAGLDQCDPGWLADGSVRYPINLPRRNCGGDDPGVRTVYHNPNRTGFPVTTTRFDAYCYREEHVVIHLQPGEGTQRWGEENQETQDRSKTGAPQDASSSPKTKTSTLSLSALESLETHGGSAQEETANSVLHSFVNNLMKPFKYWTGSVETDTEAPPPATPASLPEETLAVADQEPPGSAKVNPTEGRPNLGSKGSKEKEVVPFGPVILYTQPGRDPSTSLTNPSASSSNGKSHLQSIHQRGCVACLSTPCLFIM
ncbi:unnamed protein product [Oncorhynchus mykiss]|uniref:Link domain-containing protein n=1 Tax=Oncorhynchus mykiss TaxID=8022 RepID=A0A060Y1H1_ONCMY|nr:unnamed protein product [Oncorhynchus mykiss]